MKEVIKKEVDVRCSSCNSSQTHIRIKTNEKICHHCGHVEKLNIEDKN